MRTIDVVAVVEVLVVERRTRQHQLLQPDLGDEEAAGQVEVLQDRKSSQLRQRPQAQVGDLVASGETEEFQGAFGSSGVSLCFRGQALQGAVGGALSPNVCRGSWLTVRPCNSPEGRVAGATRGVTAEYFSGQGELLVEEGGAGARPVSAPPALPTAARAAHQLRLHKTLLLREQPTSSRAPVARILNVHQIQRVQHPHVSGAAAASPTARPRLEDESLASPQT